MNYTKEVFEKVEIVSRVLDEFDASYLLESSDFSVDEMSMESWLKLNSNDKNENKIPLSLTFMQT
ncbi:hypothetical protein [Pedobacter sp. SYP-B3415]|uniref:hypothetical protein n=1 Tax=Pedobacter sp. SYP-B3415 TaxID=2496641 RepID=UPI00101BF0EB|nr:hypothetical protein [Pedobacter sp. SYP-B3415]